MSARKVSATKHPPIPVLRPLLPAAERLLPYLRAIDASRVYSNHGPLVTELARRLAAVLKQPEGSIVCAASGTAALTGAILAAAGRAKPSSALCIVPAFTFVATASAVEQCGYHPYLADVDSDSWMLDPRQLAADPKLDQVGLVVPVAPFGRAVPQEPWRAFRRATGIPVVIDGAASFEVIEARPGRFLGDIPVALSFHATKSFATGEGGAVVTTDCDVASRIMQALNFGFLSSRDSEVPSINGKMSEFHAAVGLAELDHWPAKRAALHAVIACYRRLLDAAGLVHRFVGWPDIASCYPLFRCLDPAEASRVQQSLDNDRVDFRLWYGSGVHRQSYFRELAHGDLAVTDRLGPCLLGLPSAPDLSEGAVARVVAALATVKADVAA